MDFRDYVLKNVSYSLKCEEPDPETGAGLGKWWCLVTDGIKELGIRCDSYETAKEYIRLFKQVELENSGITYSDYLKIDHLLRAKGIQTN